LIAERGRVGCDGTGISSSDAEVANGSASSSAFCFSEVGDGGGDDSVIVIAAREQGWNPKIMKQTAVEMRAGRMTMRRTRGRRATYINIISISMMRRERGGGGPGGQCKREIEIGNADRDIASLAKKSGPWGRKCGEGEHELPPLSNMPLSLHGSIV
jgi:hypothetical protein